MTPPPTTSNPNDAKISILSTVRNEQKFISEMLDSIENQSHSNWELLLVDDGSTDLTASIIESRLEKEPRIRLLSRGVALGKVAAFNLAHERASGDVVVLMAGDDRMAPGSLAVRAAEMLRRGLDKRVVGCFKLRTISDDAKFAGMLLPRGKSGSHSGPSLTMTRSLASTVFPIPSHLVSEDTWLGEATNALAEEIFDSPTVVVEYRIHSGNSNPRQKTFRQMDQAMHRRSEAWTALLAETRFSLTTDSQERLRELLSAESFRHAGDLRSILTRTSLAPIDRLAVASMSNSHLFRIRTRFYRFFSGRRGR